MDRETPLCMLVSERAQLLVYVWSIVRDEHNAEDLYQELIVVAMGGAESGNRQYRENLRKRSAGS